MVRKKSWIRRHPFATMSVTQAGLLGSGIALGALNQPIAIIPLAGGAFGTVEWSKGLAEMMKKRMKKVI
jgi:hypothetical protein